MGLGSSPYQLVHELLDDVEAGPSNIGPGFLKVIRGGLAYSAEDAAAGEGGAAVEVAVAAAGGLAAVISWPVVLIVLCIAVILFMLHRLLRAPLSHVPIVGGGLASALDYAFGWVDGIVNWCGHELEALGGTVMHGFRAMTDWALTQSGFGTLSTLEAKILQQVHPVKVEADHLWVWANDINTWVDHISQYVYGHLTPAEAVQGPLAPQLHALQARVAAIEQAQLVQEGQILTAVAQMANIQAELAEISSHVVGVRAVNVGWQDVYTQLEYLRNDVHELQTTTKVTVDTHSGQINTLFPLGILLDAGAQGLRNLRKLEDDPCQCPRLPGVINELGLAMAVLHHVKGD